jgi:hypothetical protein
VQVGAFISADRTSCQAEIRSKYGHRPYFFRYLSSSSAIRQNQKRFAFSEISHSVRLDHFYREEANKDVPNDRAGASGPARRRVAPDGPAKKKERLDMDRRRHLYGAGFRMHPHSRGKLDGQSPQALRDPQADR